MFDPKGDVYIIKVAAALPNDPVENDAMEAILGHVPGTRKRLRDRLLKQNGIKTRYYAIDPDTLSFTHTNAELTAQAINALCDDGFSLEELTCLACGTASPDQTMPSHAAMVHGELDAPPCEIASFSGVCVSGIQALKYACLSVASGEHSTAVSTGSEIASIWLQAKNFAGIGQDSQKTPGQRTPIAIEKEFLRWMLSDGAGAVLLSNKPRQEGHSLRVEWIDILSYANESEVCMYSGCEKGEDGKTTGMGHIAREEWVNTSILAVKQDVKLLMARVLPLAVRALREIAANHQLKTQQVDFFLPHLSSYVFQNILEKQLAAAGLGIPVDRWFTNLKSVGNIGSSSAYLMLAEFMNSGQLSSGDQVLLGVPESGRFTYSYALLTVV